ncbi:MAG TPA: hypothetical protein VFU10_13430 [Gaiellaceae bacterium]|nr:hypothetical protein [Gaiellaceae bacterium]
MEPARAPLGAGCDHELVGGERGQRVRDRLQRVGVADHALGPHALLAQAPEAAVEPGLRGRARAILVGRPAAQPGVERRGDDENLVGAAGAGPQRAGEGVRVGGVAGDEEDAAWVGA